MSVFNFFSFSVFLVGLFSINLVFFTGFPTGVLSLVVGDYLLFDSLSFYLVLLVFFLGGFSICCVNNLVTLSTLPFLLFSLFFTSLCFCVNHAVLFWCFYELSMLPLLYLIFQDSPYSERFLAGWYFCVYLLVTSLPLILILLYLVLVMGTPFFSGWCNINIHPSVYIVLSFIFFTKVPLSPFHTWLPIVHAEATSLVSIFLSGYIMKLGLLGVYRCSPFLFQGDFVIYLFFCSMFSIFFIITSSGELDGKRWLAFLSLSHIVVPFLGFFICGWDNINLIFLFCLGHGLSAGLVFGGLWYFYGVTNSRNWLVLKSGVGGKFSSLVVIIGLLSLCSFPPTIQFFCEVFLLISSCGVWVYIIFWCLYLFFGGLIPLTLCSHLLIRNDGVESSGCSSINFMFFFLCLIVWCFFGVVIL